MSKSKATRKHHRHGILGWIAILFFIPVIVGIMGALPFGAGGLLNWVGSPVGAITLLVFMISTLWYCKMEFDEVILDYFDGGVRSFGLLFNGLVAFVFGVIAIVSIFKIWLG